MNLMRPSLDTRHGPLDFSSRCLVMGILNVTPDSFSDGGRFIDEAAAVEHGLRLVRDGADLLDIGGESTRPGSEGEDDEVQLGRVIPVIRGLRHRGVGIPISIDTRSAEVAAAALGAGADIINDVSGIRHDPHMAELLKREGVPFVVMHMQGTPTTMQNSPHYDDVIAEIAEFFRSRAEALTAMGVNCRRMIVDPGIGFGKTTAHNLALLRATSQFAVEWPLLIGASRKRFIGELMGDESIESRDAGTAAIVLHCALAGAGIVRVHEVKLCREIVDALGPVDCTQQE